MTIPANDGRRTMRVGVWNFYEEITTDGFLFKNTEASIGAGLLKPWVELYRYGQEHGIDFVTLDQVTGVEQLDAIIFADRPIPRPIVQQLMAAPIPKYLLIYECKVIAPENWDPAFHEQFDRIFTWHDNLCDGRRFIKFNFSIDPNSPYDFEQLKARFSERKMVSMVAGAKMMQDNPGPYTERVRAIRWFESNAPDDFHLYGGGWDAASFPSYRGRVDDKLAALAKYRFSICFENANGIPGYITEKILDCMRAGTVPVYSGASNISQWIPPDCYVDIRQFKTYRELHAHLAAMPAARHGQYLDRIRAFLYGPACYPFSIDCFVATITSFIAFDVQQRRGEAPAAAPGPRTPGTTLDMVQELDTMAIKVVEVAQPAAMSARESIAAASHPDLIVYLGYGDELPVFSRARALWEFYLSHFPGITAFFVRDSDTLGLGEVMHNGHDLLVGTRRDDKGTEARQDGYRQAGVWSATENGSVIRKQMAVFDYMLRKHDKPFYLYHATVTSVVDFRGLVAVMEQMPASGCFAGMPGQLDNPAQLARLNFICGTNSLFSRDMVQLLRSRYDAADPVAALPNDIWQSVTLRDIPRLALPFFSFVKPRAADGNLDDVAALTRHLLADGHFHFRVKTTSEEAKLARREDVDPWVMLKIMETILASPAVPDKNRELRNALQAFTSDAVGGFAAFTDKPIFGGPRKFALTELEAPVLYSRRA